jgi:hypothetical protein
MPELSSLLQKDPKINLRQKKQLAFRVKIPELKWRQEILNANITKTDDIRIRIILNLDCIPEEEEGEDFSQEEADLIFKEPKNLNQRIENSHSE